MANEDKLRDYLKLVTADLQKTRQQARELSERANEPIAIVGMGCRFPGGISGPEQFWSLVGDGVDAISGFPADRGWDVDNLYDAETPSFSTTHQGGFLYDAPEFDAGFFGISPREALAMDPQQRLLLEISWETLERAGIVASSLRGTRTGVFAGVYSSGYGTSLRIGTEDVGGHLLTGTANSVLSGRVAFTLGLEGPAVSVDTACSSSLVSLHLAAQALRSGECSLALAGGVTVMSTPTLFAEFARQQGLAGDGRCKSFSAEADGTGWGEGAGMLVLERLSDARRNGRRILAVIRGSAVNQDGASNGLTAPNGPAQRRVIESALAAARVPAAEVDAVEAHGTGTTLGDPIEATALLATYGQNRPDDRPLWLGSVKSNFGHTQAAAGVAGVIKMVMALRNGMLPRTLHAAEPSPHVEWSPGTVRLLTEPVPWEAGERPRRAGISGFGISGTNAHLVLEEAPEPVAEENEQDVAAAGSRLPVLTGATAWLLSSPSGKGLAAQASRLREHVLAHPELDNADVAWSLATTRSEFEHRAVVTGEDPVAGLAAAAAEQPAGEVVTGEVLAGGVGRTVFVFPGQGCQWLGMGRELAESSPVFAARLAECAAALAPVVDWSLDEVLAGAHGFESADVVQPALWAVLVSLAEVWRQAGVRPDAVVGHSQGEIAAAVVAGILSLEDAARVVALRSKALTALAGRGGMMSVAEPASVVRDRIAACGDRLALAAANGPQSTVVSGDPGALHELAESCPEVRTRIIPVDYASHSAHVDDLCEEILGLLAGISPHAAEIPMISAMTGEMLEGSELDAGYWYASLRNTVEFDRAIRTLGASGHRVFLETSPHPVLTTAIADNLEDDSPVVTGTLRRDDGGAQRLLLSFAEAHVNGVTVDWTAVLDQRDPVDLPTYAFQRQRYWPQPAQAPALAEDTAESVFWNAVESGDVRGLADTLAVDDQSLGEVLPALASWHRRERHDAAAGQWRYRVTWTPAGADRTPVLAGTWLVVTGAAVPDDCLRALTGHGAEVRVLRTDDTDRQRIAAELPRDELAGVLSLLALDEESVAENSVVPRGIAATLGLVQALGDAGIGAPLWVATRGAVAATAADEPANPVQAQAWGLGRVVGLEHPDRWGGLIDLPGTWDEPTARRLCGVLAGGAEDQVAVRPAGTLARRLERDRQRRADTAPWSPRGTVLVTGGTGSIGAHIGPWLAEHGARRVVLPSRSGPSAALASSAAALVGQGTAVDVVACDIAERDQMAGLLDRIAASGPALSTVIHAANVFHLTRIEETDIDGLATALAAKVAGAVWLDELTGNLDEFVLFSSIAATWGSNEHGVYAAANAHLDALAECRRARGLPATSIAWGVWDTRDWDALNAATAHEPGSVTPARLLRQGMRFLPPEPALAAMGRVLAEGDTFLVLADMDWARFAPVYTAARSRALLERIPEARQNTGPAPETTPAANGELARGLTEATAAERSRIVTELVRTHAAATLGHDSAREVPGAKAFRELGFDSLTAVELRKRLNAATGLKLPSSIVFDYPNPAALAERILGQLLGTGAAEQPAAPAAVTADPGEPLAIIGMGCRFPGGAASPEQYWDLLTAGADVIAEFPTDRGWDADLFDPDPDKQGKSYTRFGGFLYDAAEFDPRFFGISPREALAMDPQQRLLLEVSWEALERAGIDPESLRGTPAGVFAGAALTGYGAGMAEGDSGAEGYLVTGNSGSVISGRVAYTLGLEGPAVTIDTACSSSLVALNTAGQALRTGECSLALVGGVMVMAAPGQFIGFSRQRGLSVDGRCKAFSAEADGMGMSEGAGMLAVERLSDARRLGHPVLAVIRGTAMNQDGASNGLTAPNGPAQQRVIRAALADAGLRSSDVDAVEAHGTGTVLGDPIEAGALIATYGQERDQPLWLGSVKSNIGHTQTAAGVAGLIKMVLALQHKTLPRTLHAGEPSLHIDWDSGQVRLLTEELPWISDGASRRAGVSAFGMSGTNVHVILEEAPDEPAAEVTGRDLPVLATEARAWPVSGRTGEGLAAQAGRLREYVLARPELDPADLAWSLATTRASFGHRAVVLGAHREELAAGLAAVATGQPDPGVITGGAAAGDRERVAFVFPGQGSQWLGMGRRMLAESPLFAARFAECGCALSSFVDWDLTDVVNGVDGAPGLDSADVMQPVLWAIMVSLAEVWRAAGVRPDAVLGHSQGEIAAACVAGVLSVEDAARVVALRSKALSVLDVEGGMLSVVMPAEQVSDILEPWGERLSVAAVNSPTATVVSGSPEALTEFERELRSRRVMRWRIPATDFVAHSVLVEPLAETLPGELAGIQPAEGEIPFFSTVESRWLDGTELDADYWYANVRKPVRFAESVLSLAESGYEAFIEVSAHPVLTTAVEEVFDAREDLPEPMVVGTLHREDGGAERILRALGEGHVRGVDIDWAAVLGGGHRVELPTYAFQHQHYWPQPKTTATVPGQDSGSRTAEARFWAAVEEGDLHTLADTLAIEDRTRLEGVLPALASWRRRERGDSAAENWRFRVAWAPVAAPTTAVLSGTWLAVSSAELPEHPAARTLAEHGAEVITIAVDTVDRAALAGRLAGLRPDGVVSLLALDESTMDGYPAVPTGLAGTLALVQALGDAGIDAPLWALTRGAVATGSGEVVADPRQAQVWGLGRTVAAEHPDRWGGLIDLPEAWDERAAGRFCAVLAERDEDQVALRGNGILARRLARAPLPATSATHYRPRGTVLITGGTGAIGGHVGRWLTAREARRVVLTSRSGPQADGVAGLAADLAGAGADVDILTCDTGERGEIAGVLDRIAATGPALSTVMHAAGALDDGVLDRLNPERLSSTLSGKAAGAVWLDELTADLDLDAFVLFSSTSATFGNGGQGNYAAANCFLDALAEDRRARGLAGLSLAWGPWDGGGVGQASEGARQRLARNKWEVLMDPELAVRAMGQAIEDPDSVVLTLMEVDFDALATERGAEDLRNTPFLRDLPELRTAGAATPAQTGVDTDGALYTRLSGLPETEQQRVLVDLIRAEAAMVMGYDSAEVIEQTRAFSEMGLDSLTSVELRNRLNTATGLHLPTTLLFDHPDPVALAAFLRAELLGADPVPADIPGVRVTEDEPLAIVAMGCRFPGGVRSPEELWELLATGGDAISGLPTDRGWDLDTLYDPDPDRTGTLYVREGGFLHDAPEFDAGFFGISPREALAMDPQQRLLLEVSWEALERGGIDLGSLRGSRTGVFIGGYFSGYDQFTSQAAGGGLEGHLMTGNATSVLSGRVSYLLGLEGPALTVDTACSSSLVALHMACQALRNDECSLALVGGVTVMATPRDLVGFSRQRGLSVDGRCKAFSASADGMGMAEGAGMLAVERLSDARHNGRRILAVIRGSAVNQDGASNGLTAPNGPSQQRVIRAALADAGLSASDVDAVEAHGTGTTLGDPIEAQALLATYGQGREQPVWLGSVKSNIGHAQAAAGVAGVIKMVLALRHGELPRTLHADEPSPHVDWSAGAMRLLSEPVPWQAGDRTRRAGVSGFGMSGTNAHVILEEAPAPVPAESTATAPVLSPGVTAWPVSARTAAALAAQAGRLREFVLARPEVPDGDVAWSLASTRSVFEHRAVVLGDARDELAAGLAAVATGADALTGVAAPGAIGRRVFVFPGQGSQWLGMGRELAGVSPVFAARLAECAGALSPFMDWSLDDVVSGVYGFESADVVQPALWAVMVSLAEVWRAVGVVPDAVVGHSQGEIAAAVVAGVLSLDDGARVVSLRSKALATLAGQGGMMSIAEPADVVRERIQSWGVRLSVAAVNGPQATVVSGDPGALEELADSCPEVRTRMIPVDYASHSGQVDALREEIFSVLDGISPQQGDVPMVSAMTGEMLSGPELDAEYWFASLREPVEFERAIRTLGESGHGVFVEASPHPVLTTAVTDTLEDADPIVVGTLRRDDGGADRLLASFGEAFVRGVAVDWTTILGSGTTVDLPTYAFQHERYWVQPGGTATGGSSAESAFWAAVEHGDPSELAATLAVNDECIGDLLPALISWRRNEREESAVADWRYRITWNPVTESGTTTLTGTWLVLGRSTEVTRALTERGAHVVTADRVDRAELAQFDRLAGVVSLLALDETPTDDGPTMTAGLAATLDLVHALGDTEIDAPLWVLTRGAVATAPGEAASPAQAQAWGLGRVVGLEHPERWGGLADLPENWDERIASRLCAVLAGTGEDQVALRQRGILARRLTRAAQPRRTRTWTPRGSVLVTGGTGAIGGQVGRWAAGRGAERVVLAASNQLTAEAASVASDTAAAGSEVLILACDTTRRAELAGLLDRIAAEGPALTAVVHAAGAGQATSVADTSTAELAEVSAAKAAAAIWLDELIGELDAFVVFSSIAATWGSALVPGYAAGNAALDALVERRRAHGRVATSIAWGPWADGTDPVSSVRHGLRELDPAMAVRALAQVLDGGEDLVTIADVDWATFAPAFTLRRPSPLFESLAEVAEALTEPEPADSGDGPALVERLAGLPPAQRDRELTELVRTEAARVLDHTGSAAISPDRAFSEIGFDSLTSLELRNRLSAATGVKLPSTVVFEFPTPAALAAHLLRIVTGDGAEPERVLTEVDRLESMLIGMPVDQAEDDGAARITARLEAVLARWKEIRERADGPDVSGRLESADDDEVFEFIGKEFGIY